MGTTTLLKWKLRKGSLWRTKFTPHLTRWEYGMTWRRGVRSMVAFYLQPPTQEIIAFPTQGTRAVGHFGNSLFLRNTLGIPSKARFVGRSAFLTGGRDARGLYKSHRPQRPHCFILRFGIWNSTGPVTPIWRYAVCLLFFCNKLIFLIFAFFGLEGHIFYLLFFTPLFWFTSQHLDWKMDMYTFDLFFWVCIFLLFFLFQFCCFLHQTF